MIYNCKELDNLKLGLNITYRPKIRLWLRFIIPLPIIIYGKYHDFLANYKGWRILVCRYGIYKTKNYSLNSSFEVEFFPIGKQTQL